MRPATAALPLAEGQREVLEKLTRSRTARHRDVQRARALLLAADGIANTRIAARLGVSPTSVVNWRARFSADGLRLFGPIGKGRGRKPSIAAEKVAEIVRATLEDTPPGETH
jgi:transposase